MAEQMAICYHPISLIKHQNVNHRKATNQERFHPLIHQLPKSTWCRYNYCRLIRQKSLLLLDGHSSDKAASFNLFLIVWWDDSLNHIFDLHSQLSCWRDYKRLDTIKYLWLLLWLLLLLAITALHTINFLTFFDERI